MSNQRLSGKDIDVMIGDMLVHVEEVTLTIEDATSVTKTRGIPNGYVNGEVSASGDITVDTTNLQTILDAAKSAGSFRALEPFDQVFNGTTSGGELRIEAFGCKLRMADLLNANASGGEKLTHKLAYDVTDPDFVRINGVSYVDAKETENLV
ncbi:phage protein [Hahella ganghwensis]|uniref:phage protein n=1 Tax=Hahella ganghwensis TaxID=286420 RepID=UPI000381BF05|nr:phage protein [Hahella ganghwensis]